ncbi:unnamed protein product [Moneuplotes crassus]|uniref:Uncharacterized protein n=1 Tax=Euplotes crassus TaxID=5936 RepID=A0AAD1XTF3_EUPCR|nr:unnamed protein product [Moneuplotes crassus]
MFLALVINLCSDFLEILKELSTKHPALPTIALQKGAMTLLRFNPLDLYPYITQEMGFFYINLFNTRLRAAFDLWQECKGRYSVTPHKIYKSLSLLK